MGISNMIAVYGQSSVKTIITNKDRTIKNVIVIAFPDNQYILCLWHILRRVPEKLGNHDAYKIDLKTQLIKCVYDAQSMKEFEGCRDMLITMYNFYKNPWL